MKLIVLLTDFGESEYVGMMKGVIYSVDPDAKVEDLTHSIPPQSVREGAWVLLQSYKYYPRGTVFVCVVDPGVGTERDAVIVDTKNYKFIGPDNGLLHPAAEQDGIQQVFSISIESSVSRTFHGRDVFAKAAAHISIGRTSESIGKEKQKLDDRIEFYLKERVGEIVRIDRFGNIITNLPPLEKPEMLFSTTTVQEKIRVCGTFAEGPDIGLFVVTGSSGTLEIVSKNTSAAAELYLKIGDRVSLE
ncbi:MAG: SAM-dependent chlorinase/fluorinase [Candidatus Thorarchaeota archaeon]|nr:MAG: SAM-dependent chlorinase/fluorinase [Candidatus Thorarchaeota archaeon]